LAELVAARRPSVSAALGKLAEAGEVTRDGDEWTLRGSPAEGHAELPVESSARRIRGDRHRSRREAE
jgi:hypothetical protein